MTSLFLNTKAKDTHCLNTHVMNSWRKASADLVKEFCAVLKKADGGWLVQLQIEKGQIISLQGLSVINRDRKEHMFHYRESRYQSQFRWTFSTHLEWTHVALFHATIFDAQDDLLDQVNCYKHNQTSIRL